MSLPDTPAHSLLAALGIRSVTVNGFAVPPVTPVPTTDLGWDAGVFLTLWDRRRDDNAVAFGPFETLQAALDAVEAATAAGRGAGVGEPQVDPESLLMGWAEAEPQAGPAFTVLLSGCDETEYRWDAYEPDAGESARALRRELGRDAAEYAAEVRSERQALAAMAHGVAGWNDYEGGGA